jgi:two-component system sensor histidine kinase DesK
MRWAARLGPFFALAWLVLLWPLLGVFHESLPRARLAALVVALGLYAGLYSYFCFGSRRRRDFRVVSVLVVALGLLALAINELAGVHSANTLIVPIMVAGFGLSPRPALAAIVGLTFVALVIPDVRAGLSTQESVITAAFLLPQLVLAGVAAMGLRYLADMLFERAARDRVAQLAVAEERARISRDLHDLLGHSLALITMKGELARRQIPAGSPGAAEVREIVALSRQTLRQVREAVSAYRQPTLATELTAARTALDAAGIACDVEQSAGALATETEAVLGWAVREGVTNVIRHSGARHCSIVLGHRDGVVTADVLDDGGGAGRGDGGNGLRGLRDRVDAIGGSLDAGPLPARGFRLRVTAPASLPSEPA